MKCITSHTLLAQSVERQPFKLVVEGSSPSWGAGKGGRHVRSPKEEMERHNQNQLNGTVKILMCIHSKRQHLYGY